MKPTITAVLLFVFAVTAGLAQTFRTGKVYNTNGGELTVVPRPQFDWRYTWYSPEVLQYPNGDLGFYTHTGNPSVERTGNSDLLGTSSDACGAFSPAGMDDIYSARRNSAGAWTTPAFGQCPKIKGMARHCTYNPPGNIDATGSPSIVRIANSYSSTGYRYYMAFNNGNSDISVGKLYWAVSDDGENWNIYTGTPPPGYQWKPLIGPQYLDCNGGPSVNGVDEGISEGLLVFDPDDKAGGINPDGTFYIYFMYSHYRIKPDDPVRQYYDILAFRFGYNPAHPYGFGANPQIYYDGQWQAHSGQLVWDYNNQPPVVPGEPVMEIGHSMLSWRNSDPHAIGRGDLKRNPDTGVWYHMSSWGGKTYMQWNTRLDQDNWTVPVQVTTSSVDALYTPQCSSWNSALQQYITVDIDYDTGLWYGTVGGWRGWWMWQPVHVAPPADPSGPPYCFQGLGMVITKLCMNNQAGCDS